jgi:cytochrome o ubiquinol oxidase subunit 3
MSVKTLTHADDHDHHNADSTDLFGFWLYIMSDCILFASLFATFIVLQSNHAFSLNLHQLISLPYVLCETIFLLVSNFTFGLAVLSMYKNRNGWLRFFLVLTFIFGACFVGLEIHEFIDFYSQGYNFHISGAASSFYALVGTHGFHVSMGLIWIATMIFQFSKFGICGQTKRRLTMLGLFWNFLDIVWIFVFTIVYLMGAVK